MSQRRRGRPRRWVHSIAEVGQYLDVAFETVCDWLDQGCPGADPNSKNRFDLNAIRDWYSTKLSSAAQVGVLARAELKPPQILEEEDDGVEELPDDYNPVMEEALHIQKAKAESSLKKQRETKLKFEHDVAKGKYIPQGEVAEFFMSRCGELRQKAMRAGKVLCRRLAGMHEGEIKSEIDVYMRELCDTFSRDAPSEDTTEKVRTGTRRGRGRPKKNE